MFSAGQTYSALAVLAFVLFFREIYEISETGTKHNTSTSYEIRIVNCKYSVAQIAPYGVTISLILIVRIISSYCGNSRRLSNP